MPQTFSSHTQWTPGFHFFTAPLGVVFFAWSIKRAISSPSADTAYLLIGALALVAAIFMARISSLRVQDRLIRLEERLRLTRVLPVELHGQIEQLRPSHLIAVRFASDGELTELVRLVLNNPSIVPKEIKRQIRTWRADYFRV